jgi:hypothetical protein
VGALTEGRHKACPYLVTEWVGNYKRRDYSSSANRSMGISRTASRRGDLPMRTAELALSPFVSLRTNYAKGCPCYEHGRPEVATPSPSLELAVGLSTKGKPAVTRALTVAATENA